MTQPGSKDGSGSTLAGPAAGGSAPSSASGHSKNQLEMLELVQRGMTMIPFNAYLGIDVTEVGVGLVRMRVPYRPELVGDPLKPALHGGVLAAVIDAAGGAAVWTMGTLQDRISTIDMRVDYLIPARLETFYAEAKVVRRGRHVAVANIRTYHPDRPDETIAEGKAVYSIRTHTKELTDKIEQLR
jgi:uncharacterized protein (TIGR00369 family)